MPEIHEEKKTKGEPKAEPKEEAKLFKLSELAKRHGMIHPIAVADDRPFKTPHLLAENKHGWLRHEHNTGSELELSDADYLAALEAAGKGSVHAPANKRDPAAVAKAEENRRAEREAAEKKKHKTKKGAR